MSGVEVIGFVLGGLPLVVSAAEHYKKGFEPLVRWKRFKFGFRDFINSVDLQRQMFQLVSKKLLIRVQLPPEEKQRLLEVPNYPGWSEPDTVEAMRSRLGHSYNVCMDILRGMKQDMEELQEMLCLKDGSVDWAHPGERQWQYQVKRIQLSFSKNGTRTVQSLEKRIQDLRGLLDLLDSTDDEDSYNTRSVSPKDTTWAKLFERIRRHAQNLHSAIKNGWKCNCDTGTVHATGLQLQQRTADDFSSQFTMTFGAFGLSENDQQNLYPRRRLLITLKDSNIQSNPIPHRPKPFPVQFPFVDQLRTDFDSRVYPQINATVLPVLAHSNSTASSISSKFSSFGSIFSKSDSNLTVSSISTSNGTEIFTENSKKITSFRHKTRAHKRVGFAVGLPAKPEAPENAAPINLPIASSDQIVSPSNPALPSEESSSMVKIEDLCSTLKKLSPQSNILGYLSDDKNQKHELCFLPEGRVDSGNLELASLERLLATNEHLKMSIPERYKVAYILASSFLQLQTTPWLRENFKKQNILFYHQGDEVLVDQPYIRHSFSPTKTSHCVPKNAINEDKSRISPHESLSDLGILLLELYWGQTVESQANLRRKHLSSDGQAIGGTDYLTAIDWLHTVKEEQPKMLIKWCIFCMFDGKPNWEDTKFTQAVYANVVRPLETLKNPT